MLSFIIGYLFVFLFLTVTFGLIIFSENNFRDGVLFLLCWPLWLIPLFILAILACILAFIKNKKIDDVCDELEIKFLNSKVGKWLDRRFK